MEEIKRNKKYLIAALVCCGLALVLLIPALILDISFLIGAVPFGGVGIILLIFYFFEKRAKLIIGILFTSLFAIFLICTFVADDILIYFAVPCLIVGISFFLSGLNDKLNSQVALPILAAFFSFSFIFLWILGELIDASHISTMFFILAILFPILGIVLGLGSLVSSLENKNRRKGCLGLSISTIAFPVFVVILLIILLSNGVLIISLM